MRINKQIIPIIVFLLLGISLNYFATSHDGATPYIIGSIGAIGLAVLFAIVQHPYASITAIPLLLAPILSLIITASLQLPIPVFLILRIIGTSLIYTIGTILKNRFFWIFHIRQSLEAAIEGYFIVEIKTSKIYPGNKLQPRLKRVLGTVPKNLKELSAWIHPQDRNYVQERMDQYFRNTQFMAPLEFRVSEDGVDSWLLCRPSGVARYKSIHHIILIVNDISEKKEKEQQISFVANHDSLTGLKNRKAFFDHTKELTQLVSRQNEIPLIAFLLVDIDQFKDVNNSLGHHWGDQVLKKLSKRLQNSLRKSDTVFRVGGDEFLIVLSHLSHATDPAVVAEKLIAKSALPIEIEGQELYISISIGISIFPLYSKDTSELFKQAESTLHASKKINKQYSFFTKELEAAARERLTWINDLRKGLKNNEFTMFYQAIVDEKGVVVGAEALLRWFHPEKGIVKPEQFIQIAHEINVIIPLGDWILERCLKDLQEIRVSLESDFHMNINISAQQLKASSFLPYLKKMLKKYELKSNELVFEVTESIFMDYNNQMEELLQEIKSKDIQIAMDDFGTGYSAIHYLKKLPIDALKVSPEFIVNVPNSEKDTAIVNAIINLAHGLGLKIMAEGVTDKEQELYLQKEQCHEFQGFYYSKPLPKDDFLALLKSKKIP